MKKIFRLFAAFAATTLAFSCMEEANPEAGTQNGGSKYEGPMTTITFAVEELETKTAWDGENHTWSDGDQIKIVYGTEDNAFTVAEVVNGTVTAEVGNVDTYYAVYPETTVYTLAVPEGGTEAQLSIVIPQTQDGSFKQANIMAAKTTKTDAMFAFKNLTHIIKFTVSDNCEYTALKFMSNSHEKPINGNYAVGFDDEITLTKNGSVSKYTYCPITGNMDNTYYVAVYAGADMSRGFGMLATTSTALSDWNQVAWEVGTLTTGTVDTDRLKITSITNIDTWFRKDWFIKPEASQKGDGSSWENAGDFSLLRKLLGKYLNENSEYNGITNAWRLHNAKIHVAEGTYQSGVDIKFKLNDDYTFGGLVIYGGYPSTLSGTSVEGQGTKTTRFELIDATLNTDKSEQARLFSGNGAKFNKEGITFDGFTFTENSSECVNRGMAFYFNASSSGKVCFKNCNFDKFTGTSNGSALNIIGTDLITTLEGCNFTDNVSKNGGAVYLENTSAIFKNCIFTSNKTPDSAADKSNYGGAIASSSSTVTIANSIFSGNFSYRGGAIASAIGNLINDYQMYYLNI